MQISKNNSGSINTKENLKQPLPASFNLPEKVLQFGTGVLLRGLPDYFVDKANKQGLFNGRVVMVKSTSRGSLSAYEQQDNVYTLVVRGIERGEKVEEYYLNNAISRVLKAQDHWADILELAGSSELEIVISNTTEVGIQLVKEDIKANPPESFPGKLLAVLLARYEAFQGDPAKGLVIIPTELIIDNGDTLKKILVQLAEYNELPGKFITWLKESNSFCNTLVDRIVPGRLPEDEQKEIEKRLGYEDALMIATEPYRLWAIGVPNEKTKEILSFSKADTGVILTEDIRKYRKLKLRLLNATHTFSCALAYLSGINTVREAMEDPVMGVFIKELMLEEIAPTITGELITKEEAEHFAMDVMDRFQNPFIIHKWLSISFQYTLKVNTRLVPLLAAYSKRFNAVPQRMAKGVAAYILFMRTEKVESDFQGTFRGEKYKLTDDKAEIVYQHWQDNPENPVRAILSDQHLWDIDLTSLPGFAEEVEKQFLLLREKVAE